MQYIEITARARGGAHIYSVCKELAWLSQEIGEDIALTFNGIPIHARPDLSGDDLINVWLRAALKALGASGKKRFLRGKSGPGTGEKG